MASRIDFSISCTPICAVAAGENQATETIAADVGQTLSSSGSVAVTWGTTVGYAAGVATPIATTYSEITVIDGATAAYKFLWVKNISTSGINIDLGVTAGGTTIFFTTIPPTKARFFTFDSTGFLTGKTIVARSSGMANGIIEVMATA